MITACRNIILGLAVASFWGALFVSAGRAQQYGSDFERHARRAVPRDTFPVFHNPRLVPASRVTGLSDEEWVIGIALRNEAKAYPIAVMGVHELGNDTCGGEPIAVAW